SQDLFASCQQDPKINIILNNLGANLNKSGTSGKTSTEMDQKFDNYFLENIATSLVLLSQTGEFDGLLDRENEILQVQRILLRNKNRNVILVGENGVGKTSIVNSLANQMRIGKASSQLNQAKIYEINIPNLVSLVSGRGFEA